MRQSRWKFSVAVLLPVITAVLVTIGLAAGFVVWSAGQTDQRALDRQLAFAANVVKTARSDFEGEQATEVLRPEATDAVLGPSPDLDWIADNFGDAEYSDFGHNRVYVLDPELRPLFAARDGEEQDITAYDADRAVVDPLAVRFRAPELAAGIAAFQAGNADAPPQLSDWVVVGGRLALVSALPIVSDWEGEEQAPGHYYTHVAFRFLDSEASSYLADDYMLDGVHFDVLPNTLPKEAAVPIANEAGRFVAWFKWLPDRPGAALLYETLPASLGLLGVIALVLALLLLGLARSTRALEKARADALFRATHDQLTGLANRALFAERLERSPLPLTLLALDLDRFKAVNDTLGHEAGDDLLKQVAARLTPLVRETDIVARLGGDEFMILLSGKIDAGSVESLARRVLEVLGQPFRLGSETANIGVSVGIASALKDGREDLVSRADYALYDAKESGRNTFRMFDDLKKAA